MSTAGAYDPKTPYERRQYTMDFSLLLAGASIVSAMVSIIARNGGSTTGMIDGAAIINGTVVGQWIKGGTARQSYTVMFQIVDSTGAYLESDATLPIADTVFGTVP